MRFQVTQVMDAIEQRLTTDVTLAQAVVDLGQVVRSVELDQGRPVSLVRVGMVIDALSRHLVDNGAILYGVVDRPLLSESALTSKERMVLGRWADDGLIEVVPVIGDRVIEIADMTGLPVIAVTPYREFAGRYGWLTKGAGRVLSLCHHAGTATLSPLPEPVEEDAPDPAPVVGRAKVPERLEPAPEQTEPAPESPAPPEPTATEPAAAERSGTGPDGGEPDPVEPAPAEAIGTNADQEPETEPLAQTESLAERAVEPEADAATEADGATEAETPTSPEAATEVEAPTGAGAPEQRDTSTDPTPGEAAADADTDSTGTDGDLPLPVVVFANRGIQQVALTRISWRRFRAAEPNRAHARLLGRQWRCDEFECPVFGEHRRIGQPVPRMRNGVPTCPRHDRPVVDVGPREPSYTVSIVVDELPRRRLVVRRGRPLSIGSVDADPDAADDPDLVSVTPWLHRAAAAWISTRHVRLEADDDGLVVTDLSDNGTLVWLRTGPDAHARAKPLRGESYRLGDWDSVELYTGIELMRGDRRLATVLGYDELTSVLLDAPTAAHHQVSKVSA